MRAPRGFSTAADAPAVALHSSSRRRARLKKCLGPPRGGPRIGQCRQHTWPGGDGAWPHLKRKKSKQSAPGGDLSLDHRGPSMWPRLSSPFYCLFYRMPRWSLWMTGRRVVPAIDAGGFVVRGAHWPPTPFSPWCPHWGHAPDPAGARGAWEARDGPPLLLSGPRTDPVPPNEWPTPAHSCFLSPRDLLARSHARRMRRLCRRPLVAGPPSPRSARAPSVIAGRAPPGRASAGGHCPGCTGPGTLVSERSGAESAPSPRRSLPPWCA
jgi:hypothetical protein